jgi:antitoxin ParD1/3/4
VAKLRKTTVSLSSRDLKRIERLINGGFCLSARDAVRKGLAALEADIEEWLRKEVVPVYDEYKAHPERSLSAQEVFDSIRAHHEAWVQKKAERHPHP